MPARADEGKDRIEELILSQPNFLESLLSRLPEVPFLYAQIKSTFTRPNIKKKIKTERRKICSNTCGEDEDCVLKLYYPLKELAKHPGDSNPWIPWLAGTGDLARMLLTGQLAPQLLLNFHHSLGRVTAICNQQIFLLFSVPTKPQKQLRGGGDGEEAVNLWGNSLYPDRISFPIGPLSIRSQDFFLNGSSTQRKASKIIHSQSQANLRQTGEGRVKCKRPPITLSRAKSRLLRKCLRRTWCSEPSTGWTQWCVLSRPTRPYLAPTRPSFPVPEWKNLWTTADNLSLFQTSWSLSPAWIYVPRKLGQQWTRLGLWWDGE